MVVLASLFKQIWRCSVIAGVAKPLGHVIMGRECAVEREEQEARARGGNSAWVDPDVLAHFYTHVLTHV